MNKTIWFKQFACCMLVRGQDESLIYDLQRAKLFPIDNEYVEVLELAKTMDLQGIADQMGLDLKEIREFFWNFVGEDLGFFTEEPERYPEIDFTWYSPHEIANSIIELDQNSPFHLDSIVKQLDDLACKAIQIRLLHLISIEDIRIILRRFEESRIKHIELILPSGDHDVALSSLFTNEPRLNIIRLYGAPKDEIIFHQKEFHKSIIAYTKDIRLETNERLVPSLFPINLETFSEALQHNVGLNRKVCIDRTGNIKNYLDHEISYGNVLTHSLYSVVMADDFRWKWFVGNDKIVRCSSCKYRYCCVSNSDIVALNGEYYKSRYCDL